MKFAHMGDCHLGGWRQPELQALNTEAFHVAISKCIQEKVEFVIISGDLFDSAYPPIEVLKDAFAEFRRLKEQHIPVFFIAGSHDYSASGKTFLDVLDKAGLATWVDKHERRGEQLILLPTIYKGVAFYGYSGKKSGLEVADINMMKLQEAPGMFRILVLHTALKDAIGSLPIPSVDEKKLPKVDYVALSHLHIEYVKEGRVYSGPLFPNNGPELEELKGGSFYIFDSGAIKRIPLVLKPVIVLTVTITNAYLGTDKILALLEQQSIKDAVVLLKIQGTLEQGKASDLNNALIEQRAKERGAYCLLRSTSALYAAEYSLTIPTQEVGTIEEDLLADFEKKYSSELSKHASSLFTILQMEKGEEEKVSIFTERLLSEVKRGGLL
ncbi:exonuclease SbcCD subunit D [Candidatus Pacearchaeota archaeon]|nr:exonuclease SbcCD subunit D [Candidatus Pacearchaeota archaeon]